MRAPLDLARWAALARLPGVGDEVLGRLISSFSTCDEAVAAGAAALRPLLGDAATAVAAGPDAGAVDEVADWLARPGNRILVLGDEAYPGLLAAIPDPPALLYVKGRAELLSTPSVAVVGGRSATAQGLEIARDVATALVQAGITVVSGLALGIDAAAHAGALAGGGATVAVMGTGADLIYPSRNLNLAHELADRGALVTEFPLGTPARGFNFPRRNRIISGLCLGCLVVEANLRSGSLITARLAGEQGRDVFAVPGSVRSPMSRGCHALIKQGAKLVEDAADVLEDLGWASRATPTSASGEPAPVSGHEGLLGAMGYDPVALDTLVERTGLRAHEVSAALMELELEGRVSAVAGGLFQRLG